MYIRQYERIISDSTYPNVGGGIHPYYELLYISSGEALIEWIGNTYKAKSPALFILTPSSPHRIKHVTPRMECWFVELRLQDQDYMPSLETINAWNRMQEELSWDEEDMENIVSTLMSIEATVNTTSTTYSEVALRRIMSCDIQKLLLRIDHFIETRTSKKDDQVVTTDSNWSAHAHIYELIRFMEMCYTQEISLEILAKRSGYTPSYIIRLFKEITDLTPVQYLYELRMHAATSYLRTTQMSVQDIAEAVGFPGIHYFSRMFKKKFGHSPTEWKRKHLIDK